MATIDTDTAFAVNGTPGLVARIAVALRDWNDARITRRALSRLSARELDDIGLCRGDIDMIAARGTRR